ncbi:HAMP domain-containing protein [Leptospira andrefontaineae]|uniref:HAMP domain-containing protein n=1 Tax=Leptospira andrefontaineae TaxID=2484976 RepID=A0A4R9H7B9_9LEPT|nr:HAMP domain-containing protein [Leptospira andrefontaineae]TGK41488.1 HAMP domain-containing protein [Leptospira andrefontaineae]
MDIFQFSYHSIGYISGTIFTVFLIASLLKLKSKTKHAWILISYLLFVLFLNFGFLIRTSLFLPSLSKPACFLIALYTSFSNLVLLYFIYSFFGIESKKESKISLFIIFSAGMFGFLFYVLKNINSEVSYNFSIQMFEFQEPESTAPMGSIHFLTFIWVLIVILRQYIKIRKELKHESDAGLRLEKGRTVRMSRNFGLAILLHALFSLTYTFYGWGYLSFSNFQLILTSVTSLQLFLYTVLYLNYFPEPSSFMIKIVGASLATVLILLCVVARISFVLIERHYDEARKKEIENLRENLKLGRGHILPKDVLYLISSSDQSNTSRSDSSDGNDIGSISKRMYRTLSLPENKPVYIIWYTFNSEGRIYEIGYPYESYSKMIHSIVSVIALILLSSSIFLILALPYLIHKGLRDLQTYRSIL